MDRADIIAKREAAERPPERARKRFDSKRLGVAALASAVFLGFVWYVMANDSNEARSGVRVDALSPNSGDRYGLLTARGPEADEPSEDPLPEAMAVATPESAPAQVDSDGLKQALKTIEQQSGRISNLQGELTDAKVALSVKDSEIASIQLNLDRLQASFEDREKKFKTQLAQAVAEAEARALASMSHLQTQGLTDDERRRLEELKRMRERQNQSDGIVFDQDPYRRN